MFLLHNKHKFYNKFIKLCKTVQINTETGNYFAQLENVTQSTSAAINFTQKCNLITNANDNIIYDDNIPGIITGTPPKNARVVICGGGIMGATVAYHLALAGWGTHTVVIEQGK